MSDKGTVSPKEEAAEKRGRGRPRKQPQVKTSDVSRANLFLKVGHRIRSCAFSRERMLEVCVLFFCKPGNQNKGHICSL